MGTIVLRPTKLEYIAHRGAYDELVSVLGADGFDVRVDEPLPRRGGLQAAAVELAIYLFEHADNIVATAIIADHVRKTLERRRKTDDPPGERRAAIYDQDGAVIKEIILRR